ncbi:Ribosomal large subunit pseudouridine synthase B [Planctomycetes bacterium Pla163]|uniref:Pseudouridine synthase n=1 Tax=Rohdeia mirabilis TaxID=2528008 RepID=A0A518CW92_9BACT|nr:Ribosomal large subunit pseudouridine synthase B [Planctomycetes bacterium Pla163]
MKKGRPARESRDSRTGRSTGRKPASAGPAYTKARPTYGVHGAAKRRGASSPLHGKSRRPEDAADELGNGTELVRLNKYLASHGIASRRGCDELIAEGGVSIDGHIVTDLGIKVDPANQRIEVDGVTLRPEGVRHRYYLLNKPSGVVCTNSERELRPRAVDLITDRDKGRVFTVGRLDEDTTGLILITNDGDFANRVMHPRYGIDKTYLVLVQGRIDDAAVAKIRDGVHLSDGRTSGARVLVQKRTATASKLVVTIKEGKNREVRRVFARTGYKVTDLKRIRVGHLTDRGLKPGSWRPLRRNEILELLAGPTQDYRTKDRDGKGAGRGTDRRASRGKDRSDVRRGPERTRAGFDSGRDETDRIVRRDVEEVFTAPELRRDEQRTVERFDDRGARQPLRDDEALAPHPAAARAAGARSAAAHPGAARRSSSDEGARSSGPGRPARSGSTSVPSDSEGRQVRRVIGAGGPPRPRGGDRRTDGGGDRSTARGGDRNGDRRGEDRGYGRSSRGASGYGRSAYGSSRRTEDERSTRPTDGAHPGSKRSGANGPRTSGPGWKSSDSRSGNSGDQGSRSTTSRGNESRKSGVKGTGSRVSRSKGRDSNGGGRRVVS